MEVILKNKIIIIDKEDLYLFDKYKWTINNKGYVVRYECIKYKTYTTFLHQEMTGKSNIDHIDRNPLNNSKQNYREGTHQQNCFNRSKSLNTTSKYKGVCLYKANGKWKASIKFNGKCIHIGYFDVDTDAAIAYNTKAVELFGERALLNQV